MGRILEHWRVPAATLFSVALIIGAYVLARGVESPPMAQASAETALLQAIAAKDSDHDGLPDWEEALYGTNPQNIDSLNLGMTDGEAVAKGLIVPKAAANIAAATSTSSTDSENTLTSTFAQDFFALYLAAKQANGGVDLTDSQTNALADQAMAQLSRTAAPIAGLKTIADIKVFGTGLDALHAFAVAAEAVFKENMDTSATNEVQSLQDAVQNGNTEVLSQIASVAQIYRNYASGLAALTVPKELAVDILALVNTMLLRSKADNDFTRVNIDPLTTMLALQQFSQTESAFWNVFTDIGNIYASAGVALPNGTPGASFVNVIANSREMTP